MDSVGVSKVVGIKEAAKLTGLSEWELRCGVKIGKYPAFRVGGKRGKIMFNVTLLQERVKELMKDNLTCYEELAVKNTSEFSIRG